MTDLPARDSPDPERQLYVISGVQAAGKSTASRLLAERFSRGVFIDGDNVRAMVVAGREDMTPDPSPEAIRQLLLRYQVAAQTALLHRSAGFDVVVADNIFGPILTSFLQLLAGHTFHLIMLVPAPEVVLRREHARDKDGYGPIWTVQALHDLVQAQTARLGWWIDSSNLSAQETVDLILSDPDRSIVGVPADMSVEAG